MSESEEIHRDKPLWPEDTVEYRLFPLTESHYDLTKLAVECTHFARAVTRGHLWNYGEFLLRAWKEGELAGKTVMHLFCTNHALFLQMAPVQMIILRICMGGHVSVTISKMNG